MELPEDIPCERCGDDETGGFTLADGTYVCENCLTEEEKIELNEYWRGLED